MHLPNHSASAVVALVGYIKGNLGFCEPQDNLGGERCDVDVMVSRVTITATLQLRGNRSIVRSGTGSASPV